eukprot:TRINITY_DN6850_c0_g1_i3.p2 TRINITY_DN6850_c0_g1~~TRINITY_DN6850_c0_g1_i3.p2  ORF type:complete len:125 (-),score=0.77 TRINITY_DN6850_c0_g1_i3:176-550(-)
MGESLIVRRRVGDEGLRIVNPCHLGVNPACIMQAELTRRGSSGQLRASSRGNTETASVTRIYWAQRVRRWLCVSGVKSHGSTVELRLKLHGQSIGEGSGIPSVAVKCVDIRRNTNGEGSLLDKF